MASTRRVHDGGGLLERALLGSGTTHSALGRPGQRPLSSAGMLAMLDELLSLADGLLVERACRDLAAARDRLAEDRFNLVVLGEFKRGKSTLINALLERDVLPTGVVPLTSVVTAVGAGHRERLVVRFIDGREEERAIGELADYVTEHRNPGNERGAELARLELDHELLWAGLELVDTPGIGSIHSHNSEMARDFLPRVDAALCVLDAGQPLSAAERELFAEVGQRVPRLLIVINKIDHLEQEDREAAVQFVRAAAAGLLGDADGDVFAVSARGQEGLEPLVDRLRQLAAGERHALLLRSVGGLVRGAAAETAQAARFESRAIELPLDELAARARAFEARIAELTSAGAEAGELLHRGVSRSLEEHVNEPLQAHARREGARLRTALADHVAELHERSPRELSAELESWIDSTVRAEFARLVPRFEAAIAAQLTELELRYAARVRRVLEQVQEAAEDVFGARASEALPSASLSAPSRFSFKLKDVEHGLDIIVGFGRTIAPGALGRRLVVRAAEQRLVEMSDRHAGRLRSELAARVTEAVHVYRRELATAVEDAIGAIRAAIDRAGEDRRRGERHAQERLGRLDQIERRCAALASRLDRWLGDPRPDPSAGGG
ncbi:MAG: dynamin family protein [Solirubrobacteraceae bacterium]